MLDTNEVVLLLSSVEPDIMKQSKFTDHENDNIKNIAVQKLQRQRILKGSIVSELLKKFSNQ